MALIKCKNCGHMVSEKATKCPKCGTSILLGKTQETANEATPAASKYQHQNEGLTTAKRSNHTLLYAIIGILIVALLFLGYFLMAKVGGHRVVLDTQAETKESHYELRGTLDAASNDNTTEALPTYSGLTFRTFTESEYDESNSVTYQNRLSNTMIAENLKGRGFVLSDTKTEFRPDYTGEDFYDVTIETYSKTVNGHVTTVKLESEYTEIHFPNPNDVEEFKKTVRACNLKETNDGFEDSEEVYWAGTDVSIKGTIVTLRYRSES